MKKILISSITSLFLIQNLYGEQPDKNGSHSNNVVIKKENEKGKNRVTADSSSVKKGSASVNLNRSIFVKSSGLTNLGDELLRQIKKDKTVAPDLPFYYLYKDVQRRVKNKNFHNLEPKVKKLYNQYMNYLIRGGINWSAFKKALRTLAKKYDYKVGWEYFPPPYSAKKILERAVREGTFGNIFKRVEPKRFKYSKFKSYLIEYLNMPNWERVGKIPTLKPGSSHSAIPKVRRRLKLVGDLGSCSEPMESTYYDSCLGKGVKRFKLRHGLVGSTTIDKSMRIELNRPKEYYIKKMRLNLDRIKWANRNKPKVRIELNIPDFRLNFYSEDKLITTMRVVVGKKDHPTPVFSNLMSTVVVNPYWNIPTSIVRKEMLKKLIRNPYYYEKKGKHLYKGWGKNAKRIDPGTVNWRKYLNNKKPIPYSFRQKPGKRNALGKIKFLFPNKYAVYIHDTPSKKYFYRKRRAYSHGCMRIQKPRELLKKIAIYNDNINVPRINKILRTNKNRAFALKYKIPIDIVYLTSFVDTYGNLHFRHDVYGYDKIQLKTYAYKGSLKPKKRKSEAQNSENQKVAQKKRESNKKDKYDIAEIY